jgi:hypothetical protein
VSLAVRGIAAVAGYDPHAVGAHIGSLLERASAVGAGSEPLLWALSVIARGDPTCVSDQFETVLELVESADADGREYGASAVVSAGVAEVVSREDARRVGRVIADTDELATTVETLADDFEGLNRSSRATLVAVLDGLVGANDAIDSALAAAIVDGFATVLAGDETPLTVATTCDCVGRLGSTVPDAG